MPPPEPTPATRQTATEAPAVAPVAPAPVPAPTAIPIAEVPVAAPADRTGTTAPLPETAAPADSSTAIAASAAPAAKKSHWTGSSVTYRNIVTAPSFSRSYDHTFNPYYANVLMFVPQYAISDKIFLRAWQYTTFELTNADDTTKNHEVQWSDTILTVGGKVFKSKALGLSVGVSGNVIVPTSKASRARTMNFGVGLGASAGWSRGDVSISYSGRATANSFRSMYGENASSWLPNCAGLAEGCDPYISTGRRNPQFAFMNTTSLSYSATKWLGFSASAGMFHSVLFPMETTTIQVNGQPVTLEPSSTNTDKRVAIYWGLGADVRLHDSVSLGFGAETFNPQLASDSRYETPFLNRYTTFYVELQLSLAADKSQAGMR